jgi:hypothetical protein
MQIPMHSFDRAAAERNLGTFEVAVQRKLALAKTNANHLSLLQRITWTLSDYLAALGHQDRLANALRLLSEIGASTFALARAPETQDRDVVLGGEVVRLHGPIDESTADAGAWLFSFWAALAVDDRWSRYILASTPMEIMRRSSTRTDPYYVLFVEALEAYANGDPSFQNKLMAALKATDPAGLRMAEERRVLLIETPQMEMLYNLARGDQAGFMAATTKALEKHRKYWEKDAENTEGFFALGITALAAEAVRRGLRIDVESPYMPADLLRQPALSTPLSLCPYCLMPDGGTAVLCAACGRDMRRDAHVQMRDDEYQRERKDCTVCGLHIPRLAVVCAACQNSQ